MKCSFYFMDGIQQHVFLGCIEGRAYLRPMHTDLLCVGSLLWSFSPFKGLIQLIFPVSFGDTASVVFLFDLPLLKVFLSQLFPAFHPMMSF
jgi:hypothetical protein